MNSLLRQLVEDGRPVSRKRALAGLATKKLSAPDTLPTLNSLRRIYGITFEAVFWLKVGDTLTALPATELMPVWVNPVALMASQPGVSYRRVRQLLRLPRLEFDRLVQHNPAQPIILVHTPHGFVTVNGHHRVSALQALNVRNIQLPAVVAGSSHYSAVIDLFHAFGYLDNHTKQVYDRVIGNNPIATNYRVLRPNHEKEVHLLSRRTGNTCKRS